MYVHIQLSACERSQQIIRHRHLVRKLAKRLMRGLPANVDYDDMEQAGLIGLAQAIEAYDPSRSDANFEAFACMRINGSMRDALRSMDPLSRDDRDKVALLKAVTHKAQAGHAESTSSESLAADKLGWTHEQIRGIDLLANAYAESDEEVEMKLEAPVDTTADGIEVCLSSPPEVLREKQRRAALLMEVQRLGLQERLVVEMTYEGESVDAMANRIGVHHTRISKIRDAAQSRLAIRLRHV